MSTNTEKMPELTPELLKAAETVFMAKAWADTIRPTVEAYKKEILQRLQAPIAKRWTEHESERARMPFEIITDPERAYLIEDEMHAIYCAEMDKAAAAAGLATKGPGYCPLLTAESMEREARRELLRAAQYITKIDPDKVYKIEILRKMEELVLLICAPSITTEQVLKSINA